MESHDRTCLEMTRYIKKFKCIETIALTPIGRVGWFVLCNLKSGHAYI